jgi:hypothetical protein
MSAQIAYVTGTIRLSDGTESQFSIAADGLWQNQEDPTNPPQGNDQNPNLAAKTEGEQEHKGCTGHAWTPYSLPRTHEA